MKPDHNPSDWQQPKQQPSQVPYSTPVEAQYQAPIVTLTPDQLDASTAPPEEELIEDTETASVSEQEPVRWQANEYIHREKNNLWFVVFGAVVVLFMIIAIFLMQSITFAILIPVMAAALIVYGRRPPRLIDYTLSRQGLHINDRLYPFTEFKGFGVIHDGEEYSVMLLPTKRFKPGVSVYFPEEAGEAIVDMLGARLPMQTLHLDLVDRLIHKLRI